MSTRNTVVKNHKDIERIYAQCNSAPKVCEVQSVDGVLDQQLTRSEKKVGEGKTSYRDGM